MGRPVPRPVIDSPPRTELLIFDDWGLAPFADAERLDLHEILKDHHRALRQITGWQDDVPRRRYQ